MANRNPVATFEANVAGTWAVLEATRRSPTVEQVVTASSDKAYGTQPELPYDEAMPLRAVNPYDVSKACADLISTSYHATFGSPVCVTRCGNFFGPGDRNWERLVPSTVRSLLRGERPIIRSDGTMVRDYVYVVEVRWPTCSWPRPWPLTRPCTARPSTSPPRCRSPCSSWSSASRRRPAPTYISPDIKATASHEISEKFLSAAKAHRMLGWWPRFTLDDAPAATVDWYRNHLA